MRIDLGPLLIDESGCQGLFRNSVHGEARINGRKDGLWKGVDCGENNVRDGLRWVFKVKGFERPKQQFQESLVGVAEWANDEFRPVPDRAPCPLT